MANKKISVEPGSAQFNNMSFTLANPVTNANVDNLTFGSHSLEKVQKDVYAMPAFMSKKLQLMFIVAPLVQGDWVIAFSRATLQQAKANGPMEVVDMSTPMTAGHALNLLSQYSPNLSNRILKYFQTLSETGSGHWALIRDSTKTAQK